MPTVCGAGPHSALDPQGPGVAVRGPQRSGRGCAVRLWAAILLWLVPMGCAFAQSPNPSITIGSTNPPHVIRGTYYSESVVQASGTVEPYTFVASSSPP